MKWEVFLDSVISGGESRKVVAVDNGVKSSDEYGLVYKHYAFITIPKAWGKKKIEAAILRNKITGETDFYDNEQE